ncbi:hypothetical protein [Paenibacillus sp. CMAA1364]
MILKIVLMLTSIIGVICISIFLFYYDFPKSLDVTRTAVSYIENEPSTTTKTMLKIKGNLHRPIFRQSTFVGRVSIDGFDFTNGGMIWFDDRFENINIWASSEWNGVKNEIKNLYIVSNSNNFEEAIKNQTIIRNKFDGVFVPKE